MNRCAVFVRPSNKVFVYDPTDMKRWRLPAAIVVLVTLSVVGVRYVLKKRAQEKREVVYQSTLHSYSQQLKPGMSRKEVEDYFRAKRIVFRQMCCVDRKDTSKSGWDDLAKIGQEDAPWFCSETNVYIAFQFTDAEPTGPPWGPTPSDTLKTISIYRWLEGCL
jgi:hypothetical protein